MAEEDTQTAPEPQATAKGCPPHAGVDDELELNTDQPPPATFFDSQIFRVISLFLYLGGISGLGMVLSLYYLIFFDSRMPDIHLKFPVSISGQPVQKVHDYLQ